MFYIWCEKVGVTTEMYFDRNVVTEEIIRMWTKVYLQL